MFINNDVSAFLKMLRYNGFFFQEILIEAHTTDTSLLLIYTIKNRFFGNFDHVLKQELWYIKRTYFWHKIDFDFLAHRSFFTSDIHIMT